MIADELSYSKDFTIQKRVLAKMPSMTDLCSTDTFSYGHKHFTSWYQHILSTFQLPVSMLSSEGWEGGQE